MEQQESKTGNEGRGTSSLIEGLGQHDIREAKQYFSYNADKATCPFAKYALSLLCIHEFCVPEDFDKIIIDTRTHMLKPGWYPCIPGWHLDEVQRDENDNLDWENDKRKDHFLFIIDEGTGSLTEFAEGDYYNRISNYTELNEVIKNEEPDTFTAEAGRIYHFTNRDAHRGMPATGSGWRYFFRATIGTQREFRNEIRTQTQVYIPATDVGW